MNFLFSSRASILEISSAPAKKPPAPAKKPPAPAKKPPSPAKKPPAPAYYSNEKTKHYFSKLFEEARDIRENFPFY